MDILISSGDWESLKIILLDLQNSLNKSYSMSTVKQGENKEKLITN